MSIDHYENFPVASILLPARLRPAVRSLYAFARGADDIADEGDATTPERQNQLQTWRNIIKDINSIHKFNDAIDANTINMFVQLRQTINQYQLPLQPFLDLLSAFEQDLYTQHYDNTDLLLDYCTRSANPVGILMLHLFDAATPLNIEHSNAICTGLQLANFCQDIAIDYTKGRCYIPLSDMQQYGTNIQQLADLYAAQPEQLPGKWQALIKHQCERAQRHLQYGSSLAWRIPGRMGIELRLVVHGGLRILEMIADRQYNPFTKRPMLGFYNRLLLCLRAVHKPKQLPLNTTL